MHVQLVSGNLVELEWRERVSGSGIWALMALVEVTSLGISGVKVGQLAFDVEYMK